MIRLCFICISRFCSAYRTGKLLCSAIQSKIAMAGTRISLKPFLSVQAFLAQRVLKWTHL